MARKQHAQTLTPTSREELRSGSSGKAALALARLPEWTPAIHCIFERPAIERVAAPGTS